MTIHQHFANDHLALRQRVLDIQTALSKEPSDLEAVFLSLQQDVRAHFRKEDTVYYPFVDAGKKIADRELIHSLRNDHAAVIFALESLAIRLRKKVPLKEWAVKFEMMVQVLLSNFDREENKLFPEVERIYPPAVLQSLLDQIQAL